MHLSDGIVEQTPVVIGLDLLGAACVAAAVMRAGRSGRRGAAWTGTLAAFVLAAQSIDVPVLPGTSAHVVGAGLLTLALGPARAIVALFAVLLVQAIFLADGGITVLGINALNLAVLPCIAVYAARRLFDRSRRGLLVATIVGTVAGSMAGAASLALSLIAGADVPVRLAFGWLVGVQTLAGVAEALVTALAVRHLLERAPRLIVADTTPTAPAALDRTESGGTVYGLRVAAIGIGIAIALLPLASRSPDALERVLEHVQAAR